MVQEFHVVRCFSCETFQVQQVKKVNKWSCKLCGQKQSLLKEFGRGSGPDCRRHVQKLNAMRGANLEKQEHNTWLLWEQVAANEDDKPDEQRHKQSQVRQTSCWSKYLNTPEEPVSEEEYDDNVLMDRFHSNNKIDRKRKRQTGKPDQDNSTLEQSDCSSLNHTGAPGLRNTSASRQRNTSASSLKNTSASSLKNTSASSLRNNGALSLPNTSTPTLNHTSAPSLRNTSATSLNTSAPSLKNTSTSSSNTSPPTLRNSSAPDKSVQTGTVSKWAHFLNSDCQVSEGECPSDDGWRHSVGGTSSLSCNDKKPQTTPPSSHCLLLPGASMFQSGEEFSFDDDDFLSADQ